MNTRINQFLRKQHNFTIFNAVVTISGLFIAYCIVSAPLHIYTPEATVAILIGTFNMVLMCIILSDLVILHKRILEIQTTITKKV